MSPSVRLASIVAAVAAAAPAYAQTTIDSFSNGVPLPLWVPFNPPNDGVSVEEKNNRLEFTLTPPGAGVAVAGFQPNGWGIVTKSDFRVKATWRFLTPVPAHTYAAVLINASVIGRPRLSNGLYEGVFTSFGSLNDGDSFRFFAVERVLANAATVGVALYSAEPQSTLFTNNLGLPAFAATETATVYLRYATVTDNLFISMVGYDDPNAVLVTSATGGTRRPLQLYLAARAQQPKAQAPSNTWIDELILDVGSIAYSKTPTLLWRNPTTGAFTLWTVAPNGSVSVPGPFAPLAPSTGWRQVGVGDFNGDGQPDIFWRNEISGVNYIWYLAGNNFIGGATPPGVPVGAGWQAKVVGDLNRDGYADVVWQQQNTGEYLVWLMQGGSIVGGGSIGIPGAQWSLVASGDMNKDGRDDLIWQNVNNGKLYVWYMNGTAFLGGASLPSVAPSLGWTLAGAIDLNRDGQDDLVWRHAASGQTIVWVMNGLQVVATPSLPVTNAPWTIAGSQ